MHPLSFRTGLALVGAAICLTDCAGSGSGTLPANSPAATTLSARATQTAQLPSDQPTTVPAADTSTALLSHERVTESTSVSAASVDSLIRLKCAHGPPLHGPCSEVVAFPAAGGYTGTVSLPSGSGSMTVAVAAGNLAAIPQLHTTPVVTVTFKARSAVTMNGIPGFTLSVPAGFGGTLRLAQHGSTWNNIGTSQTVANGQVSFAPARGTITLATGRSIVFAVYGGSSISGTVSSISGTVVDFSSGAALSGFTVTLGSPPNPGTCLTGETSASNACSSPASVLATATTSASGAFSLSAPTGGYMLTVGSTSSYATLHRSLAVRVGTNAVGTLKVAALSTDEQAWLADINIKRATVSVPQSFANLSIDEYAEEAARAEANAVAAGTSPYGDATEGAFAQQYAADPGAMYALSGVADMQPNPSAFVAADAAYFAEIANCPGGNWQTCAFAENTGHYMNLSSTANIWIGVGESSTSSLGAGLTGLWAYAGFQVADINEAGPASIRRRMASIPIKSNQ